MVEDVLIEYATTVISDGTHGTKIAYAEKLIMHEKYDGDELNDDIGLIKVKTPFEIDFADFRVRLPLQGAYFSTGTPAVLAGESHLTRCNPLTSK